MRELKTKRRLVIIGLDGMPYRLIANMAAEGVMPNTAELITSGTFRAMSSSIPEISCVSWSSIITGENPGVHGIYGFTDVMRGGYGIRFPNYASLAAKPFWEMLADRRAVILNVPSTYPARPMNGVHVSGFVTPKLEKGTYPSAVLELLGEHGYRVDVDSGKGHQSIPLFLEDLNRTLSSRIAVARALWDREDWLTFMLVFTGTDRLGHFLWAAYEDSDHPYHAEFLDHLRQIDQAIGEFVSRIDDNDVVIMLSDHGFERIDTHLYVNRVLQEHGFLAMEETKKGLSGIADRSLAFALDPGRIYVHSEQRFPRGTVAASEAGNVCDELVKLFEELAVGEKPAIRSIHRRDEIYAGPMTDQAPDIVLVAERGVNLKASFAWDRQGEDDPFTGKHSQPDAFLLVRGTSDEAVPEHPNVVDVVSIINDGLQGGQAQ